MWALKIYCLSARFFLSAESVCFTHHVLPITMNRPRWSLPYSVHIGTIHKVWPYTALCSPFKCNSIFLENFHLIILWALFTSMVFGLHIMASVLCLYGFSMCFCICVYFLCFFFGSVFPCVLLFSFLFVCFLKREKVYNQKCWKGRIWEEMRMWKLGLEYNTETKR